SSAGRQSLREIATTTRLAITVFLAAKFRDGFAQWWLRLIGVAPLNCDLRQADLQPDDIWRLPKFLCETQRFPDVLLSSSNVVLCHLYLTERGQPPDAISLEADLPSQPHGFLQILPSFREAPAQELHSPEVSQRDCLSFQVSCLAVDRQGFLILSHCAVGVAV